MQSTCVLSPSAHLCLSAHLPEEVHDTGEDDEQDTTSGTQPEHLGRESLVQGREALLFHDRAERRPGPVVLGCLSCDLGRVLDARLDDIHGGVQDSTDSSSNSTRDEIVCDLALLISCLGQQCADLEDAAKVAGVPENVPPHRRLQSLIQREGTLLRDCLPEAVDHAIVLVCLRLVLEPDLDQLEWDDDEGFGGSCSSTRQDRQGLIHLRLAEDIAVECAPRVIGCEFGCAVE